MARQLADFGPVDHPRGVFRGHIATCPPPPWSPKALRALVGALDGSKAAEGGLDPQGRSSLSSANAASLGRSSEGTFDP